MRLKPALPYLAAVCSGVRALWELLVKALQVLVLCSQAAGLMSGGLGSLGAQVSTRRISEGDFSGLSTLMAAATGVLSAAKASGYFNAVLQEKVL